MLYCNLIGGELFHSLKKILLSNQLLQAVRKAGSENTSQLESYHSTLNHYAPKMLSFSHDGMVTR